MTNQRSKYPTDPVRHRRESFRAVIERDPESREWDVRIEAGRGAAWILIVTGVFGAGGLELSDHSPAGNAVQLAPDLFEALHDAIEEKIEELRLDDDE